MALFRPWPLAAPLGRTDAGVDYARSFVGPIYAIADSTVIGIRRPGVDPQWGGLGAVYLELAAPIVVADRTYHRWYTAEHGHIAAGVEVGAKVIAGQVVALTRSGWQETGFLAGQDMNSQVPTQAGLDFRYFALAHQPPGPTPVPAPKPLYVRVLGPGGHIIVRDQPLALVAARLPTLLRGYSSLTLQRL